MTRDWLDHAIRQYENNSFYGKFHPWKTYAALEMARLNAEFQLECAKYERRMGMKKVQLKSGQGPVYTLVNEDASGWVVDDPDNSNYTLRLPKSEYHALPVEKDVTHECGIDQHGKIYHYYNGVRHPLSPPEYWCVSGAGIRVMRKSS